MGATIIKKGNSYRVRFRYKGLKDLSINFKSLEIARKWIEEHEEKYIENPDSYHKWLEKNRNSLRSKGFFHKFIPGKDLK